MKIGSFIVRSVIMAVIVSAACVAAVKTKSQAVLSTPQEVTEFIPASLFWNAIGTRDQWSGKAGAHPLTAAEEISNINYIGVNHHFRALGTHHQDDSTIRDFNDMDAAATIGWGAFGHPIDIDANHCTNSWVDAELKRARTLFGNPLKQAPAHFKFYELANEPDLRNQFSSHGENYNPADLPPCMAKFYSQIRNDSWFDNIAIVGPSLAFVGGHVVKKNGVSVTIPGMSTTANLENVSEISNVHVYYHKNDEKPGLAMQRVLHGNRAYLGGSHPVFVTETGRKSNSSQQSQARKIVAALVAAIGNGAARVYQFTPYDWTKQKWGLMTKPDANGNFDFKLSGEAVKRLLDLVKTDTCNGDACSRVLPNFSVTSAAGDVLSVPVYNSGTKRHLVFLWRDSGSNDDADADTTPTTVDFGVNIDSCSVHRLTNGSVESASKSGAVVTLGVTNFVSALECRLSGDKPFPEIPESLEATVSGNVVRLEWETEDEDNTDGYTIYRKLNESRDILGYRPIAALSASTHAYVDILPALPGAQYKYSIRAKNWKRRSGPRMATVNVSNNLQVFEDFLDNDSNIKDKSSNWTIDNPNQIHYDRDDGVARRTDDNSAYLVYEQPNVHAIQVIYFRKEGSAYNNINLYRKSGRSWVRLTADYDAAPALAGTQGNTRVIVTSNEVLPSGSSQIKIEVTGSRPPGGGTAGILEAIGRVRFYHTSPN